MSAVLFKFKLFNFKMNYLIFPHKKELSDYVGDKRSDKISTKSRYRSK